jgi:hypothetical protein
MLLIICGKLQYDCGAFLARWNGTLAHTMIQGVKSCLPGGVVSGIDREF